MATLKQESEALTRELVEARIKDEQLRDRLLELEAENTRLTQELQKYASTMAPLPDYEAVRDKQSLLALRDRILRNWRVAKAPEKKERIKEALDRFIEALKFTPASTPKE